MLDDSPVKLGLRSHNILEFMKQRFSNVFRRQTQDQIEEGHRFMLRQSHGILQDSEKQNMNKHVVNWKRTPGKNIRDQDCEFPFPALLNASSKWTLLELILRMEPKTPITFTDAALLAHEKFQEAMRIRRYGGEPGQAQWYTRNFTSWISSLGYHIELTGDEFELHGTGIPTA